MPLTPKRASSCALASGEKILMVWSMPDTASSGSYLGVDFRISFPAYAARMLIGQDAASSRAPLS